MLGAIFIKMCLHGLFYLCISKFSVGRVNSQHLMSCGLYGTRLMHVDMSAHGTYHSLIGSQGMGDDGSIGLCTSYKEMYIGVISLASLPYQRPCLVAIMVFAISYGLFHIGLCQTL